MAEDEVAEGTDSAELEAEAALHQSSAGRKQTDETFREDVAKALKEEC